MVTKKAAAILTMLGGAFYLGTGVLIAAVAGTTPSLASSLSLGTTGLSSSTLQTIIYAVAGFDILSGALIMVGGFLLNSANSGTRRIGGILALVMMVLGALTSFGGFVIGFILTMIGSIFGLTYKSEPPVAAHAATTAPQYQVQPQPARAPDYTALPGRANYCLKCGARLREGSVFCASCGAKVPD
jgi:hypothetical protein